MKNEHFAGLNPMASKGFQEQKEAPCPLMNRTKCKRMTERKSCGREGGGWEMNHPDRWRRRAQEEVTELRRNGGDRCVDGLGLE